MKFKEGNKVRIKRYCSDCEEGYTYKLHYGRANGTGKENLFARNNKNESGCSCEHNWELVEKTWDNLEVGDMLIDHLNRKRRVLGVCGEIIFYSHIQYMDRSSLEREFKHSIGWLKDRSNGWRIREEVKELTMKEVCRELGRKIKIIK